MPLRDFQVTGSKFLQDRSRAVLCDDAGLGKSATVLDALDALGVDRVLCIAPAVAGVSWPIQIRTWSPKRRFVYVNAQKLPDFSQSGFYFVTYDTLSRTANDALISALTGCRMWETVVLDEAQYLKSAASNRTKAVYGSGGLLRGICENTRGIWLLSGTLAPNHAGEVYTHLRNVFPNHLADHFGGELPEQYAFENEFCVVKETTFGRCITASKNMKALRAILSPVLLRRLKKDVLKELPPLEFLTEPVDLDAKIVRDIYRDGLAAQRLDYDVLAGGTGFAPVDAADDIIVDMLEASATNLATQRRSLGLAKVPAVAAWVIARLEAGEPKIVLFAHHTDVLAQLAEALADYEPVTFQGSTSPADRAAAVDRFQTNTLCRVFVGQIVAAGTAITLTAAKTVVFAEYSGTPAVNYQAASRAHRIGQHDGVQAIFLSVPGSLDERIARTAARRAREIAEIFD